MFGVAYTISFETNSYCLDYREYADDPIDWVDRLMSDDGGWSGNLFDFYTECCRRIRRTLIHGMVLDDSMRRIDDSSMDKVVREALLNAISNADYRSPGGVVVESTLGYRYPLCLMSWGSTEMPHHATYRG